MKFLILFLAASLFNLNPGWVNKFDEAKKIASEKNELILLNFSGSDWCGPCMRMRKEIFQSKEFINFSADNLVLINADFPRNKKNRLSKQQEIQNDKLAEKYNPTGRFPFTIILTAEGKVIRQWDGLPDLKPEEFVHEIRKLREK